MKNESGMQLWSNVFVVILVVAANFVVPVTHEPSAKSKIYTCTWKDKE